MKATTTKNTYFEIKDPKDQYGLIGKYDAPEQALEYINESFKNALEQGYDNRTKKYIIVCVQWSVVRDEKGNFLREETSRFVFEQAEFSTYENAFVFVY